MDDTLTPYTLTRAEGELIELVNGAAEQSFVCTIGHSPETGWLIRLSNTETGEERQFSASTFQEGWIALRRGVLGFKPIEGGRH